MLSIDNDEKPIGFTFTWQIGNFTLISLKKQRIESDVFRIEKLANTEWKMLLDLPGKDGDNIILNLRRESGQQDPDEISIRGKLFVAKNDGSSICLEKPTTAFTRQAYYSEALKVAVKTIAEEDNLFMPNDVLTVGFQVYFEPALSKESAIKCFGKTELEIKEYSAILPLNFSKDSCNCFSIFHRLSTSTEYPEIKINLQGYKEEYPVSLHIHVARWPIDIYAQCNLSFFYKKLPKYKHEKTLIFQKEITDQLFAFDISKDIFEKNIIKTTDLKCELLLSDGTSTSYLTKTNYEPKIKQQIVSTKTDLQINLMELYAQKILCDFKICVQKKEFQVHKTILAAVSPIFRAMFESGLSESGTSSVTITDFTTETIEKFLEFSYSGCVENLKYDTALKLYSFSDKYQITKLNEICSDFLGSNLSVETIPDILALVSFHQDNRLNEFAENFILSNAKLVFQSDAWKDFMTSNVEVAMETMLRMCKLFSEKL